jgi:rifampicin phosphotransferase
MNLIIPITDIKSEDRNHVGGKAFALAMMARVGFNVPKAVSIGASAYLQFVQMSGLKERISLELNRKHFNDMRWEELWDASLRIRNMFINTPLPAEMNRILSKTIEEVFSNNPVVVRSSAPDEDSAKASFAGLHESYVNVVGTQSILEHVRKVWASLWSDAALLYRQELELDIEKSTMAVVVQEMLVGERSGVAFGRNPNNETQAVIECVYGLNQGLVDGTVEPDQWVLERSEGRILEHKAAERRQAIVPSEDGTRLAPLEDQRADSAPLNDEEVLKVFTLTRQAETLFEAPQDVEWTIQGDKLYTLQSRAITTLSTGEKGDKRPWYLSLRRSFENLKALREKIQGELIPAMIEEGEKLANENINPLSDLELAAEIVRRKQIYDDWVSIYWQDFIPFAHGVRLFGQVYNDAIRPEDPYEFMDLLVSTEMMSLDRNQRLEEMAELVRENPPLKEQLRKGQETELSEVFSKKLEAFIDKFGDLACGTSQCLQGRDPVIQIILEMALRPAREKKRIKDPGALKENFLSRFKDEKRIEAEELLDLARTSYQLRDDDNIYLGRIEGQFLASMEEAKQRIEKRCGLDLNTTDHEEYVTALRNPDYVPGKTTSEKKKPSEFTVKPRQLLGQPAGPGICKGNARVIRDPSDLSQFKAGEILVCDAVDPNMTFVVPLSEGIVERRGGMLIHGAIIAREYGLPCVTGVPDATTLIKTGDSITVDGYLGIVTIG